MDDQAERNPLLGAQAQPQEQEQEQEQVEHPLKKYDHIPKWRKPSPYFVFPLFVLQAIAEVVQITISPNLYLSLACKSHYQVDLGYKDPRCQASDIQERVSSFEAIGVLVAGVCAVWVLPRICSLSDRYGRKFLFIYFFSVNSISVANLLMLNYAWKRLSYNFLIVSFIAQGLSGTDMLLIIGVSSYIADCTIPHERTRYMSLITGIASIGTIFAPLISGRMVEGSSQLALPVVGALLSSLMSFAWAFILPESLTDKEMEHARQEFAQKTVLSWRVSLFDAFNIAKPLKTAWRVAKSQPRYIKRNIIVLTAIDILYMSAMNFKILPSSLYFQMKFGWSAVELGYLRSIVSLCQVVQLSFLVPIAVKFFQALFREEQSAGISNAELLLVRFGLLAEVLGCLMVAGAQNGSQNVVASVVESLGAISRPTIASAFLNIIPKDHLGDFLGAKGALVLIVVIAFTSSGTSIYSWSVKSFPVLIFLLAAGTYLVVFLLSLVIKAHISPASEYDDSDDNAEYANISADSVRNYNTANSD